MLPASHQISRVSVQHLHGAEVPHCHGGVSSQGEQDPEPAASANRRGCRTRVPLLDTIQRVEESSSLRREHQEPTVIDSHPQIPGQRISTHAKNCRWHILCHWHGNHGDQSSSRKLPRQNVNRPTRASRRPSEDTDGHSFLLLCAETLNSQGLGGRMIVTSFHVLPRSIDVQIENNLKPQQRKNYHSLLGLVSCHGESVVVRCSRSQTRKLSPWQASRSPPTRPRGPSPARRAG
mmetsp:Transcript_44001/g.116339  ORF Transcript_44001/g.116339 Transcript_44001/m.116339 type:complete len:234 (+) Transcript_44001:129-830(+)